MSHAHVLNSEVAWPDVASGQISLGDRTPRSEQKWSAGDK